MLNRIKEDITDKKCQFLILSPLSVLNNWQTELARFGPDLTGIVYSGSKEDRELLRANLVAQMKTLVSDNLQYLCKYIYIRYLAHLALIYSCLI